MFRPHQKREVPGKPITAYGLNKFNQEVSWLSQMRGSNGISVVNTPAGPLLNLKQPELIYATITGPCNAIGGYPWAQQIYVPGSGWMASTRVGGNTKGDPGYDPTYERRTGSTTVLADGRRYQMMRAPTSGEWLFAARLICNGSVVVIGVTSCSESHTDVTIQIFNADKVQVATCVTDESGECTITGLPPGTYFIRATAPDGSTGTAQFTITPPCAPIGQTVNVDCSGVPASLKFPPDWPNYLGAIVFPLAGKTMTFGAPPADIAGNVIQTTTLGYSLGIGLCIKLPNPSWYSPLISVPNPIIGNPPILSYYFMYGTCGLNIGQVAQLPLLKPPFAPTTWFYFTDGGTVTYSINGLGDGPPNTCIPFALYNLELFDGVDLVPCNTATPVSGKHGGNDVPFGTVPGPTFTGFPPCP